METRSSSKNKRNESEYAKLREEALTVDPSASKGLKRRPKKQSPSKREIPDELPQEDEENDNELNVQYESLDVSSGVETGVQHTVVDSKHSTTSVCQQLLLGFFVFLAICGVLVYARGSSSFSLMNFLMMSQQKRPEVWSLAEKRIRNEIKPKYENRIPSSGFRVMEIALKEILHRNESMNEKFRVPSVILLIGSHSNQNVVRCFAKDLMDVIADAYQKENGDIIDATKVTPSDIIKRFDSNFNRDKSRSIFLDGIDKLKGNENERVLHRYTDHDNSIFKDVVILLSAYDENEIKIEKNASSREMDSIANNLLERSWINSMDEDNIAAMLSRVTPSVVVLMNGNKHKFKC